MTTFTTYSTHINALSAEDFFHIQQSMADAVGTDADALELYEEVLKASIKYAAIRAEWVLMTREERRDADEGRTMKHDALIVKFNKLSRYLQMQGRDISWRVQLGYTEDDPTNRQRIGDFACFLVFIEGINAR